MRTALHAEHYASQELTVACAVCPSCHLHMHCRSGLSMLGSQGLALSDLKAQGLSSGPGCRQRDNVWSPQ